MQGSIEALTQRLQASQSEIEELRRELTRVHEEVLTDGLTGLYNRKAFDTQVTVAVSKHSNVLCLLMIDIDHFKRVNDSLGHVFGDRVIRAIGTLLKRAVKGQDSVFRYGGEEFALLLPETTLEGACSVAEHLRAAVARSRIRRLDSDEIVDTITVSIGVACCRAGESATNFIERADRALYQSKANGRNRVTADLQAKQ
jgi:diguanylate cyclase